MAANVLTRGADTPGWFTSLRPYAVPIAAALPLGEWAAFPFLGDWRTQRPNWLG